jgi:hypothetical protein
MPTSDGIAMLIMLSLIFCLIGQPGQCQTVRLNAEDGWSGLPGCFLRGQELATQWLADHPKWKLERIRCTAGNPARADDI